MVALILKVTSEKNRKSPAVFSTSYARSHAWTESPKQSPKEEFYSSEIRMKPDAFNVMSTAHRKLWVEPETSEQPRDIDSPISERMMSLSEGPILSGSECSSQKSSSVKDKAMDEVLDEEPVRDTGAATTDVSQVKILEIRPDQISIFRLNVCRQLCISGFKLSSNKWNQFKRPKGSLIISIRSRTLLTRVVRPPSLLIMLK